MKINPELTCFFPVLGSESGFVMKAGKGFKKKKNSKTRQLKGLKTTNNENWSGSDFSICSQVKGKKDNIICMFAGIHGQFKWQQVTSL